MATKNSKPMQKSAPTQKPTTKTSEKKITIYGIQSPHVARVRAALFIKGLPFQHVSVNLRNRSPEFIKLAPHGKIPVLQDTDGTVVGDSFFIIKYLDEKYPNTPRVVPNTPEGTVMLGKTNDIITTLMNRIEPLYVEKFNMAEGLVKNGMSQRAIVYSKQQKEDLKKEVKQKLETLDKIRNGKKYFTGSLSYVDIALLSLLSTLQWFEISIDPLTGWMNDRMKEKPLQQMFAPQTEKGIKEI